MQKGMYRIPFLYCENIQPDENPQITVGEGLDLYCEKHVKLNKVSPTIPRRLRLLKRVWNQVWGKNLFLNQLTARHVLIYWKRLHLGNGKDKKITRGTLFQYNKTFKAALRFLMIWGYLEPDIYTRINAMRIPRHWGKHDPVPRPLVTDRELWDVLGAEPNESARDIWTLMDLVGARPRDLTRLRWEQIDKSRDVWLVNLQAHKTQYLAQQRWLAFGDRGIDIILKHYNKRRFNTGTVFRDDRGKRWSTELLAWKLRDACEAADVVPNFTMRHIRRRFTNRMERKYGLETETILGGHCQDVARRHYMHKNIERLIEVARVDM